MNDRRPYVNAGRPARTWLVKGRPSDNPFHSMLAKSRSTWHTRKPPKDWAVGDKVFLWKGAPALCIVGTAVIERIRSDDASGEWFFTLRYTSNHLDAPLDGRLLRQDPALEGASFLKSGPAGTVFPLTPAQAARLAALLAPAALDEPTPSIALSIRQPWAELIMRGVKTIEARTVRTHKRERVLIYAGKGSLGADSEARAARLLGHDSTALPRGVVVGSVEIVDCRPLVPSDSKRVGGRVEVGSDLFAWVLRAPIRARVLRAPTRQPQPGFFRPFEDA